MLGTVLNLTTNTTSKERTIRTWRQVASCLYSVPTRLMSSSEGIEMSNEARVLLRKSMCERACKLQVGNADGPGGRGIYDRQEVSVIRDRIVVSRLLVLRGIDSE